MVETVTLVEAVTLVVEAVTVRPGVRRMDHTPAAWHAEASTSSSCVLLHCPLLDVINEGPTGGAPSSFPRHHS